MCRPLGSCRNSCFSKPGPKQIFTSFGSETVCKHAGGATQADEKSHQLVYNWKRFADHNGKVEISEKKEQPLVEQTH